MESRIPAPKRISHGQPPTPKPPGPVSTSGGGGATASIYKKGESPTSSSVGRLATPSRGESSSAATMPSSLGGVRSSSSPPSKDQLDRQRQLEQLLSLPSKYERKGGGFTKVPRPVEEVLSAAVQAVTREHGEDCVDERAELADALGFAIAENEELRGAFGDESVLDEMRLRVEQAQREAARHEANLTAFRSEAADAQRAAAEAQRLQSDLLQVQRQLAGWVVDAVERSRIQRSRVEEAKQRGASAAGKVVDTLGTQLHATHKALDGVASTAAALQVRNDELLDSLAFFAQSRAALRDSLRGMRAWQRYAHNASLQRDAMIYWRTASALGAFNAWIDAHNSAKMRSVNARRLQNERFIGSAVAVSMEQPMPAVIPGSPPQSAPVAQTNRVTPTTPAYSSVEVPSTPTRRPLRAPTRSGSNVAQLASRYEDDSGVATLDAVSAQGEQLAAAAPAVRALEQQTQQAIYSAALGRAHAADALIGAERETSGEDSNGAVSSSAAATGFEMPAWLRASAEAISNMAAALPDAQDASLINTPGRLSHDDDPRAREPPAPPARAVRSVPRRYEANSDSEYASQTGVSSMDMLRQNLLPAFDSEARPTGARSPFQEDAQAIVAARDARYAVTAAALAEAEAEAASALAHAEAEHAAQAHELMREVSPDSLADAERIADQIASETRARSSRKAALARATAKAKAAAAKDAAEKAKALYESDEVMAAAGHLGPVAWEAGVMADSALGAVASCAASLSSLDKVEAEQAAYVQQEAIETSQKTAEAAMAAMSAIQVMESFFEAKRAGMPAEPSLNDAAMDSIAAIEVAEKAFEMIRADEGEDETAELGCDDCAADAEAAVAGFTARFDYESAPQIIPKESGSEAAEGALAAVAACVMELVDPNEAHEAAIAGASAMGAVAKVTGRSTADEFSSEEQEHAAMRATAARLCAVAERIVEENEERHQTLAKAVELATRCEVVAELELAEAAVAVEETTAVPFTHPSSLTAVEINEAHEQAKAIIRAEREAEADKRCLDDARRLDDEEQQQVRKVGDGVANFNTMVAATEERAAAELAQAQRAEKDVKEAARLARAAIATSQAELDGLPPPPLEPSEEEQDHRRQWEQQVQAEAMRSADEIISERVARARGTNSLLRTEQVQHEPSGRGLSCKASTVSNEVHAEKYGPPPPVPPPVRIEERTSFETPPPPPEAMLEAISSGVHTPSTLNSSDRGSDLDDDDDDPTAFLAAVSERARQAVAAAMQGQAVLAAAARAEAAKEEAISAAQEAMDLEAQTKARAAAAASLSVVYRAEAVAEVQEAARPARLALGGIESALTATPSGGGPSRSPTVESFEEEAKEAAERARSLIAAVESSTPVTGAAPSGRVRSRLEPKTDEPEVGPSSGSLLVMDDHIPAGNLDIMDSVNPLLEAKSPRSGGAPLSPLSQRRTGAALATRGGGPWNGGQLFMAAALLLGGLLMFQPVSSSARPAVNGTHASIDIKDARAGMPFGIRFVGNKPLYRDMAVYRDVASTSAPSPSWSSYLWGTSSVQEEDVCATPISPEQKVRCKQHQKQQRQQKQLASKAAEAMKAAEAARAKASSQEAKAHMAQARARAPPSPKAKRSRGIGNIANAYANQKQAFNTI